MSTHRWWCVVCGEDTYCSNDTHALGCGDESSCEARGPRPAVIEFCSLECFLELQRRMTKRLGIYQEVVAGGTHGGD